MKENKAIKVKNEDQKRFEELLDYEADVDRRIATLLNEVGRLRNNVGRIHDDIWDDIVKRYKLDLSKGIWAYNREKKILYIKPKTSNEKYQEIEERKKDADWDDAKKHLECMERVVDKMIEASKTLKQ